MVNGNEYSGDNLVFIVGCPRSGTTWLQRLMSKHPYIYTGQESHLFVTYIVPQLRGWRAQINPQNRGGVGLACYFTEAEFLGFLKNYTYSLLEPMVKSLKPGELFIDKTPSHALVIPEIVWLLPRSRFIHIIRDTRDVVASFLAASRSWGSNWAPKRPQQAARMWVKHVMAAKDAGSELPSWQYLEVKYEDLKKDTESVLKKCFDFVDLKYDDEIILEAIKENKLDAAKASSGGSRIPVGGEVARRSSKFIREPEGFIRSAKVGSWEKDLSWLEKLLIWKVARRTMANAGYHWPLFFMIW